MPSVNSLVLIDDRYQVDDDTSTMTQAVAWLHQAPGHYLHQCWPSSEMLQCPQAKS